MKEFGFCRDQRLCSDCRSCNHDDEACPNDAGENAKGTRDHDERNTGHDFVSFGALAARAWAANWSLKAHKRRPSAGSEVRGPAFRALNCLMWRNSAPDTPSNF